MSSQSSASSAPLIATLGGLVAVVGGMAAVFATTGASPVLIGVLAVPAVLLLVVVGVMIGTRRRGRSR